MPAWLQLRGNDRIKPFPTGRASPWRNSRHFVPGYAHSVPPGRSPYADADAARGDRYRWAILQITVNDPFEDEDEAPCEGLGPTAFELD